MIYNKDQKFSFFSNIIFSVSFSAKKEKVGIKKGNKLRRNPTYFTVNLPQSNPSEAHSLK